MNIPLEKGDEPNRCCIQLYHKTATQTDISAKDVLEISCGHGGGASYLARTLRPASYVGLDANATGIAFCQKVHTVPDLHFVHGDAQNLPFPDRSFDAVINVEASHIYPAFDRFLDEVARVLRPGGHFLYADLRNNADIPCWEKSLAKLPMRLVSMKVINDEVVRGLKNNSSRSVELIQRHAPVWLRKFGREFAAVDGSSLYRDLERGGTAYRLYHFTAA